MRVIVALAVLVAHSTAIELWLAAPAQESTPVVDRGALIASIIPGLAKSESIPVAAVLQPLPPIDTTAIAAVKFDDPDDDIVLGVTAEVSVPHPMGDPTVDPEIAARRAGLAPGTSVTIVLSVEVLADGTTGSIGIVAGSGSSLADAEAAVYVRALHWIPGSVHRHARSMKIQFPVTLALPD